MPEGREESSTRFASLFDQVTDSFRRLRAFAEPAVNLLHVEIDVVLVLHRIVATHLLDVSTFAASTAIRYHHLVVRAVFRSFTSQSDFYHIPDWLLPSVSAGLSGSHLRKGRT